MPTNGYPSRIQVVPPSSLVPPPPTQQGDSSTASSALSSLRGKLPAKGSPDSKAAASAGKLVTDIRTVTRESNKRLNKDYMVRGHFLGSAASLLQ